MGPSRLTPLLTLLPPLRASIRFCRAASSRPLLRLLPLLPLLFGLRGVPFAALLAFPVLLPRRALAVVVRLLPRRSLLRLRGPDVLILLAAAGLPPFRPDPTVGPLYAEASRLVLARLERLGVSSSRFLLLLDEMAEPCSARVCDAVVDVSFVPYAPEFLVASGTVPVMLPGLSVVDVRTLVSLLACPPRLAAAVLLRSRGYPAHVRPLLDLALEVSSSAAGPGRDRRVEVLAAVMSGSFCPVPEVARVFEALSAQPVLPAVR